MSLQMSVTRVEGCTTGQRDAPQCSQHDTLQCGLQSQYTVPLPARVPQRGPHAGWGAGAAGWGGRRCRVGGWPCRHRLVVRQWITIECCSGARWGCASSQQEREEGEHGEEVVSGRTRRGVRWTGHLTEHIQPQWSPWSMRGARYEPPLQPSSRAGGRSSKGVICFFCHFMSNPCMVC